MFLYQRITSVMGEAHSDGFLRLFLIPGYGHGRGPFDAGFDTIGVLDRWADQGIPPAGIVLSDNNKGTTRTRPLCAWPSWPKYVAGDISIAASFRCEREGVLH